MTDSRAYGKAVPPQLRDPFAPKSRSRRKFRGPLGVDYLLFRAKAQRGKGGVYEALDLTVSPPRTVVVKEGRRHGETTLDGEDGYSRVRHEARVLRALHKAGAAVPKLLHEFTHNGHRYLVLEKVGGRELIPRDATPSLRPAWRRAHRILTHLTTELALIHAAGWVWRDCKPAHLFVHRGGIRLIDFEGACRIEETEVLPWGSPDYVPRSAFGRWSRTAGIAEDVYALGAIVFQVATGRLPPTSVKHCSLLLRKAQCPAALERRIKELLAAGK